MKRHVFVLGAGRSGTKFLRDCLGAASDVSAIPYDVGYVWRYGNESIPHDEFLPEHASVRTCEFIQSSLNKMAKRASSGNDFTTIVEKSVPNTLRPLFIKSVFPDARLIHLVRDGRAVVESAMRNWHSPSDRGYFLDKLRYFPLRSSPHALWYLKNRFVGRSNQGNVRLWGPRYIGMQEDANQLPLIDVCTKQWERCVNTCSQQFESLNPDDVIEVKYEKFVSSKETVEHICEFAGIEDVAGTVSFYTEFIHSDKQTNKQSLLSPEQQQRIMVLAKKGLNHYGYG